MSPGQQATHPFNPLPESVVSFILQRCVTIQQHSRPVQRRLAIIGKKIRLSSTTRTLST